MSKFFLYNGVKLPALPEWDQNRFPYAFIYAFGTNDNGAVSEVCTLVVSASNQMVYDSIGIGFRYGDVGIGKTTSTDKSEWVEWAQNSGGSEYFYVKRDEPTDALYIRVVWANFDVLNSDGSIYVAASEPVPVAGKFPLQGWLNWHVIGLCSRPVPLSVREPVAYLYNGVRLPALPEWDRGKYPYAYLTTIWVEPRGSYQLFLTAEPLGIAKYTFEAADGWISSVGRKIDCKSFEITYFPQGVKTEWEDYRYSMIYNQTTHEPFWTNTDMELFILDNESDTYTATGEIGLAASAPIPVYE